MSPHSARGAGADVGVLLLSEEASKWARVPFHLTQVCESQQSRVGMAAASNQCSMVVDSSLKADCPAFGYQCLSEAVT